MRIGSKQYFSKGTFQYMLESYKIELLVGFFKKINDCWLIM